MPKYIEGDEININKKAVKEFTDREKPRDVFWNKYDIMKQGMNENSPINIISYYGFGGIGKSALLLKLKEELIEKEPDVKFEFIDFENINKFDDILDILKLIRQDLKDKYHFSFPIFDLVVYYYEIKLGKDASKPELKSIIDENSELSFLKDVIGEIPLINVFSKVLYYADRGKNLLKDRLNNKKLRHMLEEIKNTSAEKIKENLSYYFSLDLKENLKKEQKPFVFFVDTYEKMVNELEFNDNAFKRDIWLRGNDGLICRVPNVLWVIAGREKLKWEESDESWNGTLDQHLLGTLSFEDTNNFLKIAGIESDNLIHELYDLTHGTPMYLDMCVDTYYKLLQKGKTLTIEDFGTDTNELTKRLLMYMDNNERDFTKMLAFVGEWTDENIDNISQKMLGTFSNSLYEVVKRLSFVVNENGKYKIQDGVRDLIIANSTEMERKKYSQSLKTEMDVMIEDIRKTLNETKELAKKITQEQQEFKGGNSLEERENNNLNSDNVQVITLNSYESRVNYEKILNQICSSLLKVNGKEEFAEKTNFLIEKIDDFEDLFVGYYFKSNVLASVLEKNKEYCDLPEYIKLEYKVNFYGNKRSYYDAIDTYDKLRKYYGVYNQKSLYPIITYLKRKDFKEFNYRNDYYEKHHQEAIQKMDELINILSVQGLDNSLYKLKALILKQYIGNEYDHTEEDNTYKLDKERIKKFEKRKIETNPYKEYEKQLECYDPSIYMEERLKLYYQYLSQENSALNIELKSYVFSVCYNLANWDINHPLWDELNDIVKDIVKILYNNPNLISYNMINELDDLRDICNDGFVEGYRIFNYIIYIKDIIINSNDIKLVEAYNNILMNYATQGLLLHYHLEYEAKKRKIKDYEYYENTSQIRNKIKYLLIGCYNKYVELFGKDDEKTRAIENSLMKINVLSNESNNKDIIEILDDDIEKYGVTDSKVSTRLLEIFQKIEKTKAYNSKVSEEISIEKSRYNFEVLIKYTNLIIDTYEEACKENEELIKIYQKIILQFFNSISNIYGIYDEEEIDDKYYKKKDEIYFKILKSKYWNDEYYLFKYFYSNFDRLEEWYGNFLIEYIIKKYANAKEMGFTHPWKLIYFYWKEYIKYLFNWNSRKSVIIDENDKLKEVKRFNDFKEKYYNNCTNDTEKIDLIGKYNCLDKKIGTQIPYEIIIMLKEDDNLEKCFYNNILNVTDFYNVYCMCSGWIRFDEVEYSSCEYLLKSICEKKNRLLIEKEYVILLEKNYGINHEKTLREKINLALMKAYSMEKGEKELIEEVLKSASASMDDNSELIVDAKIALEAIEYLEKLKERVYNSSSYEYEFKFDDLTSIEYI